MDSATSGDDYHSRYALPPCWAFLDLVDVLMNNRLCAVENTLSQLQASLSVHSDADCRTRPGVSSSYLKYILAIHLIEYSRLHQLLNELHAMHP